MITIARTVSQEAVRTMDSAITTTEIAKIDTITTGIEALTAVVGQVAAAAALAMNKSDEQAKACRNYHLKVKFVLILMT